MKRQGAIWLALLIFNATAAHAGVLPNPEAGSPLTSDWLLVLIILLIFGAGNAVVSKLTVAAVNRTVDRRQASDKEHADKLTNLGIQLAEVRLDTAKRDREHDQRLHELELDIHRCKAQHNASAACFVTEEKHHGDNLLVQGKLEDVRKELLEAIRTIHGRIDELLKPKKES